MSVDPVFWEFDQVWLADPQNQNSYSYARGNPIVRKDPTGLLSIETLKSNPLSSIIHVGMWNNFALGFNAAGFNFSAALLRRSTTIEPGPLNINEYNQNQYGNPIDLITNSKAYNRFLDKSIENFHNGSSETKGSFAFETTDNKDLYYSIHAVNINTKVSKSENGQYNIQAILRDTYNFAKPDDSKNYINQLKRAPVNQAFKDQNLGYLSSFSITISIQ